MSRAAQMGASGSSTPSSPRSATSRSTASSTRSWGSADVRAYSQSPGCCPGPRSGTGAGSRSLLAVAVVVIAAVVAGIVWSVVELSRATTAQARARDRRRCGRRAAWRGLRSRGRTARAPVHERRPAVIHIPQPRSWERPRSATGFPRTAEGALAQLIAIDQRAIESASVVTAQDVITAWAAPGGPTADTGRASPRSRRCSSPQACRPTGQPT